jgi:hypothetical protein
MIDLGTLNKGKIQMFPTSLLTAGTSAQGSHVSTQKGMGCFMDPPGYPTYFLRSCYDRTGNTPDHMPQAVITEFGQTHVVIPSANVAWKGVKDWDEYRAKWDEVIRSLWVPLPYEHPRVQAWILAVYAYFRHGYVDPATGDASASNLIFWPSKNVFLKVGNDAWQFAAKFTYYDFELGMDRRAYLVKKWKDNKARRKAAGKANAALLQRVKEIAADPRNYRAFQYVQQFYPEHDEPRMDLLKNPPSWGKGGTGDWWEIYEAVPNPCPKSHQNAEWCQLCGWVKPAEVEAEKTVAAV